MKYFKALDSGILEIVDSLLREINTLNDVSAVVSEVLSAIESGGNESVCEFSKKFDGATMNPSQLRLDPATFKVAAENLDVETKAAIEESIACVRDFHMKTLPDNWEGKNPQGGIVGEVFHPIQRVGLYVPGGSVPLVSTVVMTSVLAKIANVPEIVITTPPNKEGKVDEGLLACFYLCGIEEVYAIGGVQAIGALAYGTETIKAVDKVFGPGNAYVMEAKRQVFGRVGVDLLPGPSEVMVIADDEANPVFVAADLLAQAEHGSGKEKIFLSVYSEEFWTKVDVELQKQVETLSHKEAIQVVLEKALFVFESSDDSLIIDIANLVAPEHLELQVNEQRLARMMKEVTTAGCILQGGLTPTVIGDFTAGPSHTLPTGCAGRFFSGLRATDFQRRTSFIRYNRDSIENAKSVVDTFSRLESLDGHGRSLTVRLES